MLWFLSGCAFTIKKKGCHPELVEGGAKGQPSMFKRAQHGTLINRYLPDFFHFGFNKGCQFFYISGAKVEFYTSGFVNLVNGFGVAQF